MYITTITMLIEVIKNLPHLIVRVILIFRIGINDE